MASVNQDMLKKFKQLSLRQEADGTEVEVREDEEQNVKLQEIIELLVAAGYFRARIKGLSPFDKVVGGMTWCIESCNVDVDVDLLFQENSTIGQKIALTEKIVAVLPKLKCPHLIEPHQIQGLDFIHIFPVIQWLVKRSMEFRQEMFTFVRTFAIKQFNKEFVSACQQTDKEANLLRNVSKVSEVYRPHRYFKRKTTPPDDIESRVQVTLLEYGLKGVKQTSSVKNGENEDLVEEPEEHIEQLMNNMIELNETGFLYEDLEPEDRQKLEKHYLVLRSELEDGGARSKEQEKLIVLEEQRQLLIEHCKILENEKTKVEKQIAEETNHMKSIKQKKQEVEKSLQGLQETTPENLENVKEVEELVILNDSLCSQEVQFREHCKQELVHLQNLIKETRNIKTPEETSTDNNVELNEAMEKSRILKLQLAKKNRTIAALQRQLDDVPSRAELTQYQHRFIELYNQVAAKHKETKQYYTLYNTLEDTRQYMKKEMSLLNSVSDSYPEAMQSTSGKEEFLKQFEAIVESVRQSKHKVDKRLNEEKQKRDQLSQKLHGLVELQRRYVTAVRQLGIECRTHKNNLAQVQRNN